jgi:uncharacterized membrane protein
LSFEKALGDGGKLLREAFDRTVDDARRLGIAGRQELIETLLVDFAAGLVAERILFAELAKRFAPGFLD